MSTRRWRRPSLTRFCAIFRSGCRESTLSKVSASAALSRFHILPQNGVHCGLITSPMFAKEGQHIGVEAQRNLFLRPWPDDRFGEKIGPLFWNIGKVNIFVSESVNSLPVCLGSPFRIASALHDLPSSTR